jgi:hypothetical protein
LSIYLDLAPENTSLHLRIEALGKRELTGLSKSSPFGLSHG